MDGVIFDKESKKARNSHKSLIQKIIDKYSIEDKSININNIIRVHEKRKIVYPLSLGEIVDVGCIITKKYTTDEWKSTIFTQGWKVITVVSNKVYIAETKFEDGVIKYRFSLINKEDDLSKDLPDSNISIWDTSTKAYMDICRKIGPKHYKSNINCRDIVGIECKSSQEILKSYFNKKLKNGEYDEKIDIKNRLIEFLENKLVYKRIEEQKEQKEPKEPKEKMSILKRIKTTIFKNNKKVKTVEETTFEFSDEAIVVGALLKLKKI